MSSLKVVVVRSQLRKPSYVKPVTPPVCRCCAFVWRMLLALVVTTLAAAVAYIAFERWSATIRATSLYEVVARRVALGSFVLMAAMALVSLVSHESDECNWAKTLRRWLGEVKREDPRKPVADSDSLGAVGLFGGNLATASTRVAASAGVIGVLTHLLPPAAPAPPAPPVITVAPAVARPPMVLLDLPAMNPVFQMGKVEIPPIGTTIISDPKVAELLGQLVANGEATNDRLIAIHDNAQREQTRLRALAGEVATYSRFVDSVMVRANANGDVLAPPLSASASSAGQAALSSGTAASAVGTAVIEVPAPGEDAINRQRVAQPADAPWLPR